MRTSLRTALILPLFFISGIGNSRTTTDNTIPPDQVIEKNIESSTIPETGSITRPKLRELTDAENRALDEIEDFLNKYTGNGAYNYGSIERFLEGLVVDYKAVREEADTMPDGYEKVLALEYAEKGPEQFWGTRRVVMNEIRRKGTEQITEFLKTMGVDPRTEEAPDQGENKTLVTKRILLQFRFNAETLRRIIERDQLPNTRVIFPGGIKGTLVGFVRERKHAVPDGASIISPETQLARVK